MPWAVETEAGIIVVTLTGDLTREELYAVTAQALVRAREQGLKRFLVDATEVKHPPPVADLLALPVEEYPRLGADRKNPVALVFPSAPQATEAARFYVTACSTRGWPIKGFLDRPSAIDWLKWGAE